MMYFVKNDDDIYKKCLKYINELIRNTKYDLTSLQYTPSHFGNIVVELASDKIIVRFVYDRGDIYRDKRAVDSEHWSDEQLIYNHSMSCNENYELLFKAIDEFIVNN